MNALFYFFFTLALVGIELAYFRVAKFYKILDNPNVRSMHQKPTIRGGGIIFPVAMLIYVVYNNNSLAPFLLGLIAVSVIGFLDDIKSLSSLVRFFVQSVAIVSMMISLNSYNQNFWILGITFIIVTGTLNAYNFMDGINGLTGGYSFIITCCLLYVNTFVVHFAEPDLIYTFMVSLLIFNFFNFRPKAICFAGDVGSMASGFIVIYLILDLIYTSQNYNYILFLAVYGVDSVLTIVHRLILKQNIFKPHRMHLYQELISKVKFTHLQMTGIYLIVQLLICSLVIVNLKSTFITQYIIGLLALVVLGLLYIFIKVKILKAPLKGNV